MIPYFFAVLFLVNLLSPSIVSAVEIDIDHEFAVHATNQFKVIDNKIVILGRRKPLTEETRSFLLSKNHELLAKAQIASKEKGTDFRPTSHWSLGELVRPTEENSWEDRKYAFVVPLSRLVEQIYSINRGDVAVLGDIALEASDIVLIAPKELEEEVKKYPVGRIYFPTERQSMRDAVNQVLVEKGAVCSSGMLRKQASDPRVSLPRYLKDGVDYNSRAFFKPIFERYPHILYANPLNTRLETLFLKDFFWTSEGQALKGALFPEELIELANALGKWQLDRATLEILAAPFPEKAKADFLAQRNRVYTSMNWKDPKQPKEPKDALEFTASDDPQVQGLDASLNKFDPREYTNFIQTHFRSGTQNYRYFVSVRDDSRAFMRDLAFMPTAEALTFVRNSSLEIRTKNSIIAYVYFTKFFNLTQQIRAINEENLHDNSSLLVNSPLALPIRTKAELGRQQLTALAKLKEALERMSMAKRFPYTNPIEMSVIYDIIATSAVSLPFLKDVKQIEQSILELNSRQLLKTSVVLRRFLLQDLN